MCDSICGEKEAPDKKSYEIDNRIVARLGILSLRPQQRQVLEKVMGCDDDVFAVLPTGAGKTLCFMYYALACEGIVVIVYPLLSLMNDQIRRFRKAGIGVAVLRGGQTKTQRADALSAIGSGRAKVVMTNPETFLQEQVLDALVKLTGVSVVFDEAHTIPQWGESFRPAMLRLGDVLDTLDVKRVLAFTATANDETISGFVRILHRPHPLVRLAFSSDRKNIEYRRAIAVSRMQVIADILASCERPCIVFCNSRTKVEALGNFIRSKYPDYPVRCYHAGFGKRERERIEDWFRQSDDAVLVATCAYGMGMDKSNIRTSIHFCLPDSVSAFLQESGRIGRDGEPSVSWAIIKRSETMFCKSEKHKLLLSAFSGDGCIRSALLAEMGERLETSDCSESGNVGCRFCDVCLNRREKDVLGETIMDFMRKTRCTFNENAAILALTGVHSKAVSCSWLIPYFGALKDADRRMVFEAVHEAYLIRKLNSKEVFSKFFSSHYLLFVHRVQALWVFHKSTHNTQSIDALL